MDPLDQLLGSSAPFGELKARVRQFLMSTRQARRLPPVLLTGGVGVGKNLLAKALHQASGRAAGPFVHVQCNAIPETLAESLLFGHERGAFTGADRARPGYFRTAHRGTILLDEIGTLPVPTQARLLQVIEEGLVPVIGLPTPVLVDVWVICATNVDLEAARDQGRFMPDLYSRLSFHFRVPSLEDRPSDIAPLAEKFMAQACADFGLPEKKLSPATLALLERQKWPDNARGLRNMIENAVIFTPGLVIDAENLGLKKLPSADDSRVRHLEALEQTGWNISRTAKMLGISRQTLRARIAQWDLRRTEPGLRSRADDTAAEPRAEDHFVEAAPAGAVPAAAGDAERAGGDAAPPGTREVMWERRWLGLLRLSLTGPDADDTMVSARPYLDLALDKVQQFGGRVIGLSPTALDAAFGLEAIEGSAERAGFAALAMQIGAIRAGHDATGSPECRIALHAMSCLVGVHGSIPEIDSDARRRADQVMDALVAVSDQGTVVASGEIVPFLRRRFSLGASVGPGAAGHARSVLGPSLHPGGFGERPGTFVGRHAEIEALRARASMARQGKGQIVGLVGDPGVGKSRLAWEFVHGGLDSGWLVLDTASVALGRPRPFLAVVDLLRMYFDLAAGEPVEAVREKVAQRLALVDESSSSSLPAFLALLDVPVEDAAWHVLGPSQRRRQTLTAIKRLLLRESARQPLLLLFEDTHWADAETRALLDEIADGVPVTAVLLLVTFRPEFQHGWGNRSFYTHLRVEPLRGESAEHLLDDLLGADASLAALRPRLTQWTDGNPFFTEEVVRTLAETSALAGERGAYRLVHTVDGIVIPGTVEEVLASRVARLGSGPAELLRAAAVVGRQVPYAVLAAVSRDQPDLLEAHLLALQGGEFLYQVGESEEREYTFRHTLTQEVAYAGLADEHRRALHSRAMDAMSLVYATREDEKIHELAHHAFEGRVWDRAATYLRRAGRRAFARSANREAAECFAQALTALSHLPETRANLEEAIDLRLDLRNTLWPLGEIERVGGMLSEAGHLAQALQDTRRLGLVAAARCHYFWVLSRHAEAVSAGDEALELARAMGDRALESSATLNLGVVHGAMGHYGRAVELLRATLDSYEVAGTALSGRDAVVSVPVARTYLARYLAELGELSRATDYATAGIKAAESGGGPFFAATCYFGAGSVELRRGASGAAISFLERALRLCQTHRLHNWFPAVGASLGYAYTNAGRADEALPLLEQAIGSADRMRLSASYSLWLTYRAHACLHLGRTAEAAHLAEAALARARAQGERGHEAWALFLAASVVAATPSSTTADTEKAFGLAIDSARALGMRPLLAHCHAALADAYGQRQQAGPASAERASAERIRQEIGMVSRDLDTTGE